jgi:tripartite-type tricarboxylate transporter receptor subunit TctC
MTRLFVVALVAAFALGNAQAQAPAYPTKPVRIVVPFPPGGATDIVARLVADGLGKTWNQQVLVENRAGAGGTIGTDHVAKSAPDGYTLLLCTLAANAIAPSVYPRLPYDAGKDFTAITPLTGTASVIAIHPGVPARTLAELIEYAKARPGRLTFSSPGTGVSSHLAMENFAYTTGLQLIHVPYKGSAPALNALAAGEVTMTFDPISTLAPLARAGKVRALAMSGAKRSPLLPDVPTIAEAGVRGVESYTWNGLMGPAGMPREVVGKIYRDTAALLRGAELRERLVGMGSDVLEMTPDEFTAFVRTETDKWGTIARRVNAKVE